MAVSSKGNGRDHAKFSPVATASYRLLPRIRFTEVRREGRPLAQTRKDARCATTGEAGGVLAALCRQGTMQRLAG